MEIKYKNWVLDSEEELYFCNWVEELIKEGYITSYSRVENPIIIFDKVNFDFIIKGKTKSKQISKFILHNLTYTPDFEIIWSKKAIGKLIAIKGHEYTKEEFEKCIFYCEEDLKSIIDIKGTFMTGKVTSSITFPIIQKILLNKGIYIQKIQPFNKKTGLFSQTFTPLSYLFTKTGKLRTIHWKIVDCKAFLKT